VKKLKKIVCPLPHKDKILLVYREERLGVPVHKFWVHCSGGFDSSSKKCNTWIQIRFNKKHGVTVEPMPKSVKFDLEKIPMVVLNG